MKKLFSLVAFFALAFAPNIHADEDVAADAGETTGCYLNIASITLNDSCAIFLGYTGETTTVKVDGVTWEYPPSILDSIKTTGLFKLENMNIRINKLINKGVLVGAQTATFDCISIKGKGSIQSPQITIKAVEFAFRGTIVCSGKCTIITATPVDKKSFTRLGGGEFEFIVDPSLEITQQENLSGVDMSNAITDGLESFWKPYVDEELDLEQTNKE